MLVVSMFWYMLDVELKLGNNLEAGFIPAHKFDQAAAVEVEVLVHSPHVYLCCWC